jgi:hypothetical protein
MILVTFRFSVSSFYRPAITIMGVAALVHSAFSQNDVITIARSALEFIAIVDVTHLV